MAKKYRFPGNGEGTFSDSLVGRQLTSGQEITQSNFSTDGTPIVRDSRKFTTSDFSKPISLDDLTSEENLTKVKELFDQSLKIKFNTEKGGKDLFGSALLRAKVSVGNIIEKFPASLRVYSKTTDAKTVDTAYSIVYDGQYDETTFMVSNGAIRNPLSVEYSKTGEKVFDEKFDSDRNFALNYRKYVVLYGGIEYPIISATLPDTLYSGPLKLKVKGKPFSTSQTTDEFYISLNNLLSEQKFSEMEDFEQFLLNRESVPLYKSSFTVPKETSGGEIYFGKESITWPTSDDLNIDILSSKFEFYLDKLFSTCEVIDNYKANLISRFLTTASLTEFDTEDQRVKKVFQLYGRFFDDVKKFVDNVAYMNNVTYDKINNVPDLLLKNLAGLLGMDVVTSINEKNIEEYLYRKKDSQYEGVTKGLTPFETDIEIYRRIVLNASYLFKSKGTRKPLRFLLKFIGAPESFIEINEYVYEIKNKIDNDVFEKKLSRVIDGEWFDERIYACLGRTVKNLRIGGNIKVEYKGCNGDDTETIILPGQVVNIESISDLTFSLQNSTQNITEYDYEYIPVNRQYDCLPEYSTFKDFVVIETAMEGGIFNLDDYPIEQIGDTNATKPKRPTISNDYYFQKGAGWFERTDEHTSISVLDEENSNLNSSPKVIKTKFEDFTYGEKYFDRYRQFPNFEDGWEIKAKIDNKKSTPETNDFVLNRKNVDVFLNAGQAVLYDFVRTYSHHNLTYGGVLLNNLSFAEFIEYGFWNGIKVGEGKYGKKYFDLINLFEEYYTGGLGKAYDYEKTYAYLNKISPYWIKLMEQFIPATTIWLTGEKIENHNLHRPKYNWEEPCRNDVTTLDLNLETSFYDMLIDAIKKFKNIPDCYEKLYKFGNWYLQLKINGKVYTVDYDGWIHFFTSTESDYGSGCLGDSIRGTDENCENFDNPIYMLCNFEEYINCYPEKCEDFIKTLVNTLDSASQQIFNEDIKPKLTNDDCGFCVDTNDGIPQNGRAFEIEGFNEDLGCLDCNEELKLVSNSYCGICYELNDIEIGLKVIVNETEDNCEHSCYILGDTPFSIDTNRFGGVMYDNNNSNQNYDPLDPRGSIFLTRFLTVTDCDCDDANDQIHHGAYEYVPLMDSVDRYPVYKHVDKDIYLSAYPDEPNGTTGSFKITQGPKESFTYVYSEVTGMNLLNFESIFEVNGDWVGDGYTELSDIESDTQVIRHRYATGDRIGLCDILNDDGFDYIRLYLHGGTNEAQDGSILRYDVIFDGYEELNDGESIIYDEYDDVFIIKISRGENRLIHAYDQSGAPIHIHLKERRNEIIGVNYEFTDGDYDCYDSYGSYGMFTSYGMYGEYGGYNGYAGYGGYFSYGSSGHYSEINPYCAGIIDFEVKENCQGYDVNSELYRVIDPTNRPVINVNDIVIGETVEVIRVQDVEMGDILVSANPNIQDMTFCDYSQFHYGDTSSVCEYTKDVKMSEVIERQTGRIYKYVNINDRRVNVEYHHWVLVLEDKNSTNVNDVYLKCNEEAPKKPLAELVNIDGSYGQVFYDSEYRIVEKRASDVSVGDYLITTNECGVILVESIGYDDYCNEELFVDKHVIITKEDYYVWHRPTEGYDTIYIKNMCESYCECPDCIDDISYDCVDDIEVTIETVGPCIDDIDVCIEEYDCPDDDITYDFTD